MMDSSNGSKEMQANLCRSGCGFYGSAATEGMCSKCHKDYMRKKQNSPVPTLGSSNTTSANSSTQTPSTIAPDAALTAATTTATTATTVTSIAAANERVEAPEEDDCSNSSPVKSESQPQGGASSPTVSDSQDSSDGSEKGKKKRNRCHTCRKKVGLTGFECRCGGMYCSIHRYSDKHECSFDYRSHGQEEIRKNNPVVVGEKIQKL